MKLARLRIRNFRCYKEEISIDFDDITIFVGKNDAGKSSIMDALDIFLNDTVPDMHDASKGGDAKDLAIICEFEDLPDQAIIDEANPTSFAAEYLLNSECRLEIHKVYSGHQKNPKCTGISGYALHPTVKGADDLLQVKNADLKKRAKELGIDLTGIDSKVNAEIRGRIREGMDDLLISPTFIPLNEDNARKAWEGLKAYLPAFALFKSDRQSTDQDSEAQDPLKAAVKEAIKKKEIELTAITAYIKKEVLKIAEATLEKLSEMDSSLATQLRPEFTLRGWDSLFKVSIIGDEDIPINKRGSGVKRLILLNFFRAKAEQLAKEKGSHNVIYAVEEPETSQHPNNQRMLVRAFTELSEESQVILSTHTPMLARSFSDENLRYIHIREDNGREIMKGGKKANSIFAKTLGVLPDNTVKLFIGVEGKHDITFLRNISKVLIADGLNILDLEKMELDGELIFFPLGGSNLALWTSRLDNLNRPEFHLYDRDTTPPNPPKSQLQVEEINKKENCKAFNTGKKEMENYLHFEAIKKAYDEIDIHLDLNENFQAFNDVPAMIARKVHDVSDSDTRWDALEKKKADKKISNAKKHLNGMASTYMTKALLDEIDPDGDLLCWFDAMETIIQKN